MSLIDGIKANKGSAGSGNDMISSAINDGVGQMVGIGGAVASNIKDINMSAAEKMDDRGNITHKSNAGGKALDLGMKGLEFGNTIGGPIGGAIGAGVGAASGLVMGLMDKAPGQQDMIDAENKYQLGLQMETIGAENTFTKQQLMAKDGMNVTDSKQIEVEKDEIVLRKLGKSYKKVADFKGGKSHMQGGEQYVAEEGDVVFPGKDRGKVTRALKHRRWRALDSMRMQLPTDKGQEEFARGTSGVDPNSWGKASKQIQIAEGGISKDKTDNGNYTKVNGERKFVGTRYGLTFDTWRAHNKKSKPKTAAEFEDLKTEFSKLTADDALKDFKENYWDKYNLDKIENPTVAANILDAAVNQGWTVSTSSKNNINTALGIKNTNNIGETIEAINSTINSKGADFVNDSIGKQRVVRYKGSKTYKEHGKGWIENRVKPFITDKAKEAIDNGNDITPGVTLPTITEDPLIKNSIKPTDGGSTTGPKAFTDLSPEEQKKAADKNDADNKKIQSIPGFWHKGTTKGQLAEFKKTKTNIAMPGGMDIFNIESRVVGLGQSLIPGLMDKWGVGPDSYDVNTDEVGFDNSEEGSNLRKQAEKLHTIMEGNTSWWRRVFSELEGVDAIRNKLLTGQSIDAGMPAATGNMMAGLEPEELDTMLKQLVAKGEIDNTGVQYAKFIYNNPELVYTTDMKTGMAVDIATIVANPKAVLSSLKLFGKGLYKGTKLTAKGVAALAKNKTWKLAWKAIVKDAPALAKKAGNAIVSALETDYKYSTADSMDDVLKEVTSITENLANNGVKLSKKNIEFVDKFKATGKFIKSMPDRVRKIVTGNSIDEVNSMRKQVEEVAGKSFKELQGMERADIDKLLQANWKKKVQGVEDAIEANKTARGKHIELKSQYKGIQKELKAVENGTADPIELGKLTKRNQVLEDAITQTEFEIKSATDAYDKIFDEIARLEGFMDDPLYRDQFRTVVKLQQGVVNQVGRLDTADELIKGENAYQKTIYKKLIGISDKSKAVRSKTISDTSAALEAKAVEKAATLTDVRKTGGNIQASKGVQAKFEQNAKKFPKLFNALEKDANVLNRLKTGALTWAQAANIAAEKLRSAPNKEISTEIESLRAQEKGKNENGKDSGSSSSAVREEATNIQTNPPGVNTSDIKTPKIDKSVDTPKIGDKFGTSIVGGALKSLASYAPAIYNITKGLEKPDKIKRQFVSPQTREYENMSQPQINAINNAFEASLGNARNTSGGVMSNFRSNIEKAWADKIQRRAEVNMVETGRADKIAAENINTLNNAEQYNKQVASKADIFDMQSEAATNSFLAQGMQDVANITNMKKKDKMAEANQNTVLGLINSGKFKYDPASGRIVMGNATSTAPTTKNEVTPQQKNAPIISQPIGYTSGRQKSVLSTPNNIIPKASNVDPFSNFEASQPEINLGAVNSGTDETKIMDEYYNNQ